MFRALVFTALLASSAQAYAPCAPGEYEMSVEGIQGIFCTSPAPICMAEVGDGSCPGIQEGLPYGSYCGRVASGVFGCKVLDAESIKTFQPSTPAPTAPETPQPTEPETPAPTVPETPQPTEPETPAPTVPETPQPTEPETPVPTVPETPAPTEPEIPAPTAPETPAPTEPETPAPETPAPTEPETPAPTAPETPAPTEPETPPPTTPETPAPTTPAPTESNTPVVTPAPSPVSGCGIGSSPMSVEGVGTFCVLEPACVADNSDGNCPGAQDGLQWGSFCAQVRTGVYGCKPYDGPDVPTTVTYPPVHQCSGNPAGDTPVSVVGTGTFCAPQPVCSGTVNGTCPSIQEGLSVDSLCVIIGTGVYGCVLPAQTPF